MAKGPNNNISVGPPESSGPPPRETSNWQMEGINRLSSKVDGIIERLVRMETKMDAIESIETRLAKVERVLLIGFGILIALNCAIGVGIWADANFDISISRKP